MCAGLANSFQRPGDARIIAAHRRSFAAARSRGEIQQLRNSSAAVSYRYFCSAPRTLQHDERPARPQCRQSECRSRATWTGARHRSPESRGPKQRVERYWWTSSKPVHDERSVDPLCLVARHDRDGKYRGGPCLWNALTAKSSAAGHSGRPLSQGWPGRRRRRLRFWYPNG